MFIKTFQSEWKSAYKLTGIQDVLSHCIFEKINSCQIYLVWIRYNKSIPKTLSLFFLAAFNIDIVKSRLTNFVADTLTLVTKYESSVVDFSLHRYNINSLIILTHWSILWMQCYIYLRYTIRGQSALRLFSTHFSYLVL